MSTKWNYFKVVLVDGYFVPSTPDVNFNFNSQGFSLLNRSLFTIQYSFDGVNIHGDLNPLDASKGLVFDDRVENKIWFQGVDGYTDADGYVRVESWAGSGGSHV